MKKSFKVLMVVMFLVYSLALASCDFNFEDILGYIPIDILPKEEFTITYFVDDELYFETTIKEGKEIEIPSDPYKTGYEFKGWYTMDGVEAVKGFIVDGNCTFFAEFVEKDSDEKTETIYIYFYVNNELFDTKIIKKGTELVYFGEPEVDGYQFEGWVYSNGSGFTNYIYLYNDTNLYAKLTPITEQKTSTINYIVDGVIILTETVNKGEKFSNSIIPTQEGYVFECWNDENGNIYNIFTIINDDVINLYPKFVKIDETISTYFITFYVDGVVVTVNMLDSKNPHISLPNFEPSKEGCVFKGWFYEDGTRCNYGDIVHSDRNVHAVFEGDGPQEEIKKYNVTFYVDGEIVTVNMPDSKYPYISLPNFEPSKEGYKFIGWFYEDGTRCNYGDFVDCDKTVHALFEEVNDNVDTTDNNWISIDPNVYKVVDMDGYLSVTYNKTSGMEWSCLYQEINFDFNGYNIMVFDLEMPKSSSFIIKLEGKYSVEASYIGNGTRLEYEINLSNLTVEQLKEFYRICIFVDYDKYSGASGQFKIYDVKPVKIGTDNDVINQYDGVSEQFNVNLNWVSEDSGVYTIYDNGHNVSVTYNKPAGYDFSSMYTGFIANLSYFSRLEIKINVEKDVPFWVKIVGNTTIERYFHGVGYEENYVIDLSDLDKDFNSFEKVEVNVDYKNSNCSGYFTIQHMYFVKSEKAPVLDQDIVHVKFQGGYGFFSEFDIKKGDFVYFPNPKEEGYKCLVWVDQYGNEYEIDKEYKVEGELNLTARYEPLNPMYLVKGKSLSNNNGLEEMTKTSDGKYIITTYLTANELFYFSKSDKSIELYDYDMDHYEQISCFMPYIQPLVSGLFYIEIINNKINIYYLENGESTFTVKFMSEGKEVGYIDLAIPYNHLYFLKEDPVKSGWDFAGWYYEDGTRCAYGDLITKSITVYARFERIGYSEVYKLYYDVYKDYVEITSYDSDELYVIIPKTLYGLPVKSVKCGSFPRVAMIYFEGTMEEYKSISYDKAEDLSKYYVSYYSEKEPTNTGMYWHYVNEKPVDWGTSLNPYTISFISEGNVHKEIQVAYPNNYLRMDFNNPSKNGYNFIGWYYYDGRKAVAGDLVKGNLSLVAKYSKSEYSNEYGLYFDVYDDYVEVTSYSFSRNYLILPVYYNNLPVRSVKAGSYKDVNMIYYLGDEYSFNQLKFSQYDLEGVTVYYYSENKPNNMGNYWHYSAMIPTIWEVDPNQDFYIVKNLNSTVDESRKLHRSYDGSYFIELHLEEGEQFLISNTDFSICFGETDLNIKEEVDGFAPNIITKTSGYFKIEIRNNEVNVYLVKRDYEPAIVLELPKNTTTVNGQINVNNYYTIYHNTRIINNGAYYYNGKYLGDYQIMFTESKGFDGGLMTPLNTISFKCNKYSKVTVYASSDSYDKLKVHRGSYEYLPLSIKADGSSVIDFQEMPYNHQIVKYTFNLEQSNDSYYISSTLGNMYIYRVEVEYENVPYYTITYMVNGSNYGTQYVRENGTIIPPIGHGYFEGYEFVGWYINDFLWKEEYAILSDMVLEARFEKIS